jgi:putative ATP-dependent endonuclease of the OLD family
MTLLKIARLKLRNYRSYVELDLGLNPGMNVFVGENNVGKSILLQALQLGISLNRGPLTSDYWPDGTREGPISISIEIALGKDELDLISLLVPTPQKESLRDHLLVTLNWQAPTMAGEARIEFLDSVTRNVTARIRFGFQGYTRDNDGAVVLGDELSTVIQNILSQRYYHFPEFRQRPSGPELSDTDSLKSTEGVRLAAILFKMRTGSIDQREEFSRIQEAFHAMFSDLTLEAIKRGSQPVVVIKRAKARHELPISEVGAGIMEILLILTHLVEQSDRVFVIDEPEAHLHPHSQRLLSQLLAYSSVKNNQVFVISHSPYFANFKDLYGIMLVRSQAGRSMVVRLPHGYLTPEELTRASKIVWSEDKEFLFSKRVLLVEGETEYSAMPIIAKKLGQGFDENGVSVISVGGQHFGLFMKILKGFKFPFRIMCDEDALMRISGDLPIGQWRIRVSSIFKAAYQAGMIGEKEEELLWYADETVKTAETKGAKTEFYNPESRAELNGLAEKFGFRILSPDFEGYLSKEGLGPLVKEANQLYGKNKILVGRYVASNLERVPTQLASIVADTVSL